MKKAILVVLAAISLAACYVPQRPMKLRIIHIVSTGDSLEAWGKSGSAWYYAHFDTLPANIYQGSQLILYPRSWMDSTCCPKPNVFIRAPK